MLVSELDGITDQSVSNILKDTGIWNQNVSDLSDIKLLTTYTILKNRVGHSTAQRAVKHVIQSVKRAEFFGLIDDHQDLSLTLKKSALTIDDFNSHLQQMSRLEKRAFLFALGSGLELHEVQGLTWERALQMKHQRKLNTVALKILRTSVRSIKLKYLFWQTDQKGRAIPFFDVEHTLGIILQKEWADYRNEFFDMPDRPF